MSVTMFHPSVALTPAARPLRFGAESGVGRSGSPGTEDAIRALVSLGYSTADAEKAVRSALDHGAKGMSAPELIRAALARIGGR